MVPLGTIIFVIIFNNRKEINLPNGTPVTRAISM